MTKLPTLNELKHLQDSRFGQPYPRHGLQLLYWFAQDFVYFNDYNNMCWHYDPEEGMYDFHLFENRPENNGEKLLPDVDLDYYEVGNLSKSGADDLPDYVLEGYTLNPYHYEKNIDRIIVSVDDDCIDRVYVTEHKRRQRGFDKEATYRISRGLIKAIRNLNLEDFLRQTGYSIQQEDSDLESEYSQTEDSDLETGYSTEPEDSALETGYSTQEMGGTQRNEYSRLGQEEEDRSSINAIEREKCCGCIIL